MTKRNRIRRSLGWKAGGGWILLRLQHGSERGRTVAGRVSGLYIRWLQRAEGKLLTGEDIAPAREQNREAQGLYALASIRDEAGRSHGYMAVVLSMDATIQAERDFLTHIICVLLLITAVLAVLSILTAQHILIKPVNQLTDAAESFVQRRRETAPDERIAPEASGGDNRFYGTERMLAALNACGGAMPQELLAAVQTDVDCARYVLPQEEKRKVKL